MRRTKRYLRGDTNLRAYRDVNYDIWPLLIFNQHLIIGGYISK